MAHGASIARPRSNKFFCTLLLQVSLGLPLLRFPWGVHLNATLGTESTLIRRTCPSHLHLLFCTTIETGSRLHDDNRSLLLILFGQNMCLMRRRHLVWKTSSFLEISLVTFQHSLPYSRTDSTLLLFNPKQYLSLVFLQEFLL